MGSNKSRPWKRVVSNALCQPYTFSSSWKLCKVSSFADFFPKGIILYMYIGAHAVLPQCI